MRKIALVLLLFVLLAAAGCYAPDAGRKSEPEPRTVQLAAAASLEKVLEQRLLPMFCRQHPGIRVQGVYDGSGRLQAQIENGLAADIFISAAARQMEQLDGKGFMDSATVAPLLENRLVLIVPAGSGSSIKNFADITLALRPALGDPASVPAGQYAREALTALGVWEQVYPKASLGSSVTQVLGWVADGSADAGVVYATDAALLGDRVRTAAEAPPGVLKKPVLYPMGILRSAPQPEAARELAAFLRSAEAGQVFAQYGFVIVEK